MKHTIDRELNAELNENTKKWSWDADYSVRLDDQIPGEMPFLMPEEDNCGSNIVPYRAMDEEGKRVVEIITNFVGRF